MTTTTPVGSEIILNPLLRLRERLPTRLFHVAEDAALAVAKEMSELIRARAAEGKNAVLCFTIGSVTPVVCEKLVEMH